MIESPKHMLRDLIKTKDWSAEEEEEEEEEEEDSEKEEDQPRDSYHPWGYTIYHLRSDASLYDGLTIDDLRKVYCNPPTNCIPSPNFGRPDRVFLVADAEVLLDPYFLPQKNVALEGAPDLATSDAEAPGGKLRKDGVIDIMVSRDFPTPSNKD
ncbi:unnamed protein product [Alternaria alternata]